MLLRLVAAQLDQADARALARAGTDLRSGRIVGHGAADLRTPRRPKLSNADTTYILYKWRRLGFVWLPARPSATRRILRRGWKRSLRNDDEGR